MTLLVFVGPKGSGKTHVGTVVEARLGVRFIRVEPIFQALDDEPAAFVEVERRIERALADIAVVAIESTGAVPERLRALHERFEPVRLIRVHASPATCFRRFKARPAAAHIPVSDTRFHEINARAVGVSFDWDRVLDNDPGLTDDEIVEAVAGLL